MTAVKRMGLKLYAGFERVVVFALLIMLMVIVAWGTTILAWELIGRLSSRLMGGPPQAPAEMAEFFERFRLLHEVFGAFLLILIGLELMKTVVMYLDQHELHVEVVFTVAMIAIARHAIDLNLSTTSPMLLV
ncbi:MAG: phosphate-starvation-inducible PsiE family protein, partial [Candidatus Eiseniibacteriota bacterium]